MNVNKFAVHLWGQPIETEAGKLALQVADALRVTGHVVIDPEDREQVERLWFTIRDLVSLPQLREALENYLSPKPEEPTGLGAVVEDAEGRRWTLTMHPAVIDAKPWVRDHVIGHGLQFSTYADIAAVRVLAEGVTA